MIFNVLNEIHSELVGTCDGRTQSAHACLFFFLHLDGLKTPIYCILFSRIQATKKRKRVRKGTKTPPNHESGRASKISKPSLLSLFSPFLRSSREEKNLTNFSSFSALHSIALVAFSPSPLPQQTQCSVSYPSAKQKTRTNPMFCLVGKRKAKNQRKQRLRPLLFPEENPSVRPSIRPGRFCHRKC